MSRWFWIIVLATVGAASFEMLLAFSWHYVRQIALPDSLPVWALVVTILASLTAVLCLLLQPLRIGGKQLRLSMLYPPTWLAIALAFSIVASVRLAAGNVSVSRVEIPYWLTATLALISLIAWAVARPKRQDRSGPTERNGAVEAGTTSPIQKWASIETAATDDLIGHRPISSRLARLLSQPLENDQSIALIGEFGSGKTTILRWMADDLGKARKPRVLVSSVSCWGFSDSASMAVHIVGRLVETLQTTVDVTAIRGLPDAYRRMLGADALRPIEKLLSFDREADLLANLQSLPPLLRSLGLRVVLVIEDADRATGPGFDPGQLERLLWLLKELPCVTFVLALSKRSSIDVSKLCEHIEVLPTLDPDRVADTIRQLRTHCQTNWQFLPAQAPQTNDPLELDRSSGSLSTYLRAVGGRRSPMDAATELLQTPRRLKHVVRRVLNAWQHLHGEVDLNDLIVLNVVREGSADAFNFLVWNIDAARSESTSIRKKPEEVKNAWAALVTSDPSVALSQPLVEALGIRQLSRQVSTRLQGAQGTGPTDYFRRLLKGELDSDVVRDQIVLADVVRWLEGQSSPMMTRLNSAEDNDRYVRVWEYFAAMIPGDRLNQVVRELFATHLASRPVHGQPPALMACWRERNDRRDRQIVTAPQLREMIRSALPISLPCANDLYYYWSSTGYGPLTVDERNAVRVQLVEDAKNIFADSDRLVMAIDLPGMRPQDRWSIRQLIEPADQEERPSPIQILEEWRWLAPVLLDAAKARPTAILGQLARICGEVGQRFRRVETGGMEETFTLKEDRLQSLFQGLTHEALLALSLVEAGDDWMLAAAKNQSADLIERGA